MKNYDASKRSNRRIGKISRLVAAVLAAGSLLAGSFFAGRSVGIKEKSKEDLAKMVEYVECKHNVYEVWNENGQFTQFTANFKVQTADGRLYECESDSYDKMQGKPCVAEDGAANFIGYSTYDGDRGKFVRINLENLPYNPIEEPEDLQKW